MCAFSPKDSAIVVDGDLEKAITNAKSSEEVVALMRDALIRQQLVVVDTLNPDVLYETERAVPKSFARTVTVNGKKTVIEAATELELERAVGELYRSLQPVETARDEHGRFVQQQQQPVVVADAGAELASRAAATLTEKSLIDLGIDPNALREVAAQKFTQSWEDAAKAFQRAHSDWPGGPNKEILGRIIAENNLVDAEDKAAALDAAWKHMKENDLVVENPEVVAVQSRDEEIAACTTQQELDAALAKWYPDNRSARSNQQMFDM